MGQPTSLYLALRGRARGRRAAAGSALIRPGSNAPEADRGSSPASGTCYSARWLPELPRLGVRAPMAAGIVVRTVPLRPRRGVVLLGVGTPAAAHCHSPDCTTTAQAGGVLLVSAPPRPPIVTVWTVPLWPRQEGVMLGFGAPRGRPLSHSGLYYCGLGRGCTTRRRPGSRPLSHSGLCHCGPGWWEVAPHLRCPLGSL